MIRDVNVNQFLRLIRSRYFGNVLSFQRLYTPQKIHPSQNVEANVRQIFCTVSKVEYPSVKAGNGGWGGGRMCAAIDCQLAKNHVTGCGVGDVMKRLSALVVAADSFILIISFEIISLSPMEALSTLFLFCTSALRIA